MKRQVKVLPGAFAPAEIVAEHCIAAAKAEILNVLVIIIAFDASSRLLPGKQAPPLEPASPLP
jgi:hypothetical protein